MPSIESEVDLELEEELLEEGRSLSHPTADDVVVRAVETIAGLVYNFLFKGSTNRIKNNTQNFRDRLGRSAAASETTPFPQPADDDDDPSRPWHALGLTHDHYPHDVLKFAYFAQLACDPQRTPHWFTHLEALYERTYDEHQPDETHELRQLLYDERARGRWSAADLQNAVATLGLDTPSVSSADGVSVQVALDFWGQRERGDPLQRAMCEALFTRAFELELERTYVSGAVRSRGGGGESAAPAQAMRDLATTVRVDHRRTAYWSYVLKELAARKGGVSEPMSLTQAYAIFKVRPDVDDELLVFLYQDTESLGTPQELLRVREALELITVARQSARLEKFLATGKFQFRDAKDIKNMLRMAVASR
ncbi:hypothetical protein BKA62DRAFT_796094 [Auriculariales sp. MPI-PUGE-AT-0066]|nr:hypothetical protein BKA62DRAFT_796094 [Auriculariales sp. MPI-PUGE-AT-0066]